MRLVDHGSFGRNGDLGRAHRALECWVDGGGSERIGGVDAADHGGGLYMRSYWGLVLSGDVLIHMYPKYSSAAIHPTLKSVARTLARSLQRTRQVQQYLKSSLGLHRGLADAF